MQTPKRKPGKYSNLKADPYLTPEKFEALKQKLVNLKKAQKTVAAEVASLAQLGDFSENFEYQAAKGRLRGINQGILDTQNHIKKAIIIDRSIVRSKIDIGAEIVIEVNGQTKKYTILGSSETNPSSGVISYQSPLGSALIGHVVGDAFQAQIGDREVLIKVLEIN